MSAFVDNSITDAGRALLAEVQNGAVFTPTKIVMGSGFLPDGVTTRTITDVVKPEKVLTISKKKIGEENTFIVGGVYNNQDVSEAFRWRELGLYAKAVVDGNSEDAEEILYSYGNSGEVADLMDAYTTGSAVERQIDIVTYIGNDTKIDLTIASGIYVTQEQFNQTIAEIGTGNIIVDVFIPSNGWQSSGASRYGYQAEIAVEEATADHVPDVNLDFDSIETADDCRLCPTVEALDGKLRFWAMMQPHGDMSATVTLMSERGSGSGGGAGGGAESYVLPIASETVLGGVRIGDNIDIDEDGRISTTVEQTATDEEVSDMVSDVFDSASE